jgi:hypothetical protein
MLYRLSLPLLVIGISLLCLDRVLDKGKVVKFDRKLSEIVMKFAPLDRKKHISVLLWIITFFSFFIWPFARGHRPKH